MDRALLRHTPIAALTSPNIMKKNKVMLKVLVEKEHKVWVEKQAKKFGTSEAEVIRGALEDIINK